MIRKIIVIASTLFLIGCVYISYAFLKPCSEIDIYLINGYESKIELKIFSLERDDLYWSGMVRDWPPRKIKLDIKAEQDSLVFKVKNLETGERFQSTYLLPYTWPGGREVIFLQEENTHGYTRGYRNSFFELLRSGISRASCVL